MKQKYYNGCGCIVEYKNKKELLGQFCKKCGKEFCGSHIYTRVDGNNRAITRNAPHYCGECYIKVYGSTY